MELHPPVAVLETALADGTRNARDFPKKLDETIEIAFVRHSGFCSLWVILILPDPTSQTALPATVRSPA
ncbi:MAG: hypothetical protein ACLPR9_11665, partial [Acidimicrobiales bacterium]